MPDALAASPGAPWRRAPTDRRAAFGTHDIIMQYTYLDRCIIIAAFASFAGLAARFTENAGTSKQDDTPGPGRRLP